jgi:hypothetical protein
MKKLLLVLISLFVVVVTYADSPLTNTNFYYAYQDVLLVKKASQAKGELTKEMLTYLGNTNNKLDVKLAIINAIGWNHKGVNNSERFKQYLNITKKYGNALKIKATADELICYAYLKSLDDYFNVIIANEFAELAVKKNPESFAINMISGLIKVQDLVFTKKYCAAFQQFNQLKINSKLKMDMRLSSQKYIFEYMDFVGSKCD